MDNQEVFQQRVKLKRRRVRWRLEAPSNPEASEDLRLDGLRESHTQPRHRRYFRIA